MHRPCRLVLTLSLLAALLLPSVSPPAARAQVAPADLQLLPPSDPAPADTPPPPPPQPVTVLPVTDPALPSLTLRVQSEPLWAAVGDLITTTLTVANQAAHPADELVLTLARPGDAAPLPGDDPARSSAGWQWRIGTLAPQAAQTVTITMRLTAVPIGEALLLQPTANARGLTIPITGTGGVLVTTTPAARPGPPRRAPPAREADPAPPPRCTTAPTSTSRIPCASMTSTTRARGPLARTVASRARSRSGT